VVAGSLTIDFLLEADRVTPVAVDLTTPTAPGDLVDRAVVDFGRVDVLVNSMGGMGLPVSGFLAVTDEDFEWTLLTNLFVNVRATRAALAVMVQQGAGAIVNVASVRAFHRPDGVTVGYDAAAAAVVDLTTSLAREFQPRGIRVNAISPGPLSPDQRLVEREDANGRFTTAEDVAALAVFLASERSANVTGANYPIPAAS
jgi:NAD(P)-dependent dehydrogenase (short-subunit alcohol dehydrogenase family)